MLTTPAAIRESNYLKRNPVACRIPNSIAPHDLILGPLPLPPQIPAARQLASARKLLRLVPALRLSPQPRDAAAPHPSRPRLHRPGRHRPLHADTLGLLSRRRPSAPAHGHDGHLHDPVLPALPLSRLGCDLSQSNWGILSPCVTRQGAFH